LEPPPTLQSFLCPLPSGRTKLNGAERKQIFRIDVQDVNRGSTHGGLAVQVEAVPLEMLVPAVTPRREQLRNPGGFGINPGEVGAFVKIAVNASESQVVEVVGATVNLGEKVFDVENGQRRILRLKLAILTPVAGSFPNARSGLRIHGSGGNTHHLPSQALKDGDELEKITWGGQAGKNPAT